MNYVRYAYIKGDTRDFKDGEIFTVYREDTGMWAFGMKVQGRFTLTKFLKQDLDEKEVKYSVGQAKKQINFCKKYGWSYQGKKEMNPESFELDHKFVCIYCQAETFDTAEPCVCRNTKIEDLIRKTPTGFILPY